MKWFRITSLFWQLVVLLTLAIILGWDSDPVLGSDGRIACELYEFPNIFREGYGSISLAKTRDEILVRQGLVDHAPILYVIQREPIKVLQWLVTNAPFVEKIIPRCYRYCRHGGTVMVISVTPDEWKRLQVVRREDTNLAYQFFGEP